jgi:hypothetical protein
MASAAVETPGALSRLAPPALLSAGSLMVGQAVRLGWNDKGLLLGFAGFVLAVLWFHAERLQRASSRLVQLEDLRDANLELARITTKRARRNAPRRSTLLGRARLGRSVQRLAP